MNCFDKLPAVDARDSRAASGPLSLLVDAAPQHSDRVAAGKTTWNGEGLQGTTSPPADPVASSRGVTLVSSRRNAR